jgi:hypothetical protein
MIARKLDEAQQAWPFEEREDHRTPMRFRIVLSLTFTPMNSTSY